MDADSLPPSQVTRSATDSSRCARRSSPIARAAEMPDALADARHDWTGVRILGPLDALRPLSKSRHQQAESDVVSDVAGLIAGRIAGLNESAMPSVVASVLPSDVASSASQCPIAIQASLRNHKGIPEWYINCILT